MIELLRTRGQGSVAARGWRGIRSARPGLNTANAVAAVRATTSIAAPATSTTKQVGEALQVERRANGYHQRSERRQSTRPSTGPPGVPRHVSASPPAERATAVAPPRRHRRPLTLRLPDTRRPTSPPSACATGTGACTYLLTSPDWNGTTRDGATRITLRTRIASIVDWWAGDGPSTWQRSPRLVAQRVRGEPILAVLRRGGTHGGRCAVSAGRANVRDWPFLRPATK